MTMEEGWATLLQNIKGFPTLCSRIQRVVWPSPLSQEECPPILHRREHPHALRRRGRATFIRQVEDPLDSPLQRRGGRATLHPTKERVTQLYTAMSRWPFFHSSPRVCRLATLRRGKWTPYPLFLFVEAAIPSATGVRVQPSLIVGRRQRLFPIWNFQIW